MRQQRIYGGGYARYGLGGLGFIAFEILDKHGQGIAYTIGQTDIGHIIMSHKLPLFVDIAGTRLVGSASTRVRAVSSVPSSWRKPNTNPSAPWASSSFASSTAVANSASV